MITVTDRVDIERILRHYRHFEECLLQALRLGHFGLRLELEFGYIWERRDDELWKVAAQPSTVVLIFEPVEEALVRLCVPEGLLAEPSRANWGLSEVAVVRLEEPRNVSASVQSVQRHRLVVAWEREQQIDVVFRQLKIDDPLWDGVDARSEPGP